MFGDRLRHLRAERDLTQGRIAAQLGVTTAAVGMWERGQREPDGDMLCRIADMFGVSLDYLLGRSGVPSETMRLEDVPLPTLSRCCYFQHGRHGLPSWCVGFARRGRDRLADRGWTPGHARNGRNGRKNTGVI